MSKTRRSIAVRKGSKNLSRKLDAVDLVERMIGSDPDLKEQADRATLNALVAQLIYQTRNKAGLTQAGLARLIGTRQSVISRLEDADYDGHSLSMLNRIAEALGKRLDVRLVDAPRNRAA